MKEKIEIECPDCFGVGCQGIKTEDGKYAGTHYGITCETCNGEKTISVVLGSDYEELEEKKDDAVGWIHELNEIICVLCKNKGRKCQRCKVPISKSFLSSLGENI